MRSRWMKLLALFGLGLLHAHVAAVPPPSAAMSAATISVARDQAVPQARTPEAAEALLPVVHVAGTALSVGSAAHGRLLHGIQLPQNDALYTIRNPENTWGSSHAIEELQLAIAAFRRSYGFERELVIEDMSQHHGGRFPPHHSHRSGRDVDVELPLKVGVPVGTIPRQASLVNWDAAWSLVKSLIATGEVRYIFLSRTRQDKLYEAAQRAGATEQELEEYIQYPHHGLTAYVRHSHGHDKHIHVRFTCAPYESDCSD
jgi:murein endopeptidase